MNALYMRTPTIHVFLKSLNNIQINTSEYRTLNQLNYEIVDRLNCIFSHSKKS